MGKTSKIVFYSFLSIALLLVLAVLFSPFGRGKEDIERNINASIEIDAPVAEVYAYLGNSANASKWSVYVDHITPLNKEQVPDGMSGSIRRCYTQKDEKGTTWDEMVMLAEPNRKRQLSIYNMQDFSFKTNGLATEQVYEAIDDKHTRLTFSLFYMNEEERLTELLKTYLAAYRIKYIFNRNLENIKTEIERSSSAQ